MKRLLVTFFYLGYVPFAPGTAASIAAAALCWIYFMHFESPWPLLMLAAATLMAGIALGRWAMEHFGSKDPGQFVLDEAAGQVIACAAATPLLVSPWPLWVNILHALILFRLLDIFKPQPVRNVERLPGGLGIMADDILAGALSAIVLLLVNAAVVAATA
jgi:phosphatidylglycerophosphatase A